MRRMWQALQESVSSFHPMYSGHMVSLANVRLPPDIVSSLTTTSKSSNFPSTLRTKLTSTTQNLTSKDLENTRRIAKECPKCHAQEMTWSEAQLRSADEGSTIFYRCPDCGHRWTDLFFILGIQSCWLPMRIDSRKTIRPSTFFFHVPIDTGNRKAGAVTFCQRQVALAHNSPAFAKIWFGSMSAFAMHAFAESLVWIVNQPFLWPERWSKVSDGWDCPFESPSSELSNPVLWKHFPSEILFNTYCNPGLDSLQQATLQKGREIFHSRMCLGCQTSECCVEHV
jgi:DNA-directed RNA polymerase subunit M/transcription elongation factor TFIIS